MSVTTCLAEQVPKGSKLVFEASGKLKGTSVVAAQRGTTVSVEKLFHNLPVRRRELERNIKRDWQKVISLLNQYACILTNVKFAVSQQPTKGKRIVLFSTKGNPTTRDNIINIFGAKTMGALVPLDLTLEMQPTTLNPALQIGIDPDTVSKDVRIIGHVSRPLHGEGRQTPDRQMFFVNGRPCGLPQFAKTFNEVYRSYNSSQSPFILADIKLDTHMYDVNVSPDKRTILLHDQNHLLDSIRSSLTGLFDTQDYTVPVSQLLRAQKTYVSKTMPSASARSLTPLDNPGMKAGTSESESEDSDASEEVEQEEETYKTPVRHQIMPRRIHSTSKSVVSPAGSILDRWVKKKAAADLQDDEASSSVGVATIKGSPLRVVSRNTTPDILLTGLEDRTPSPPPMSTAPEDSAKPIPVKDFNKRLAESKPNTLRLSTEATPANHPPEIASSPESEVVTDPIPAVQLVKGFQSSQHGSILIERSLAKRSPPHPVKVFIGGEEASSPEQERMVKRPRTNVNEDLSDDERPTFGNTLTQMFAAERKTSTTIQNLPPQRQKSASTTVAEHKLQNLRPDIQGADSEDETTPVELSKPNATPYSKNSSRDEPSLFVDQEPLVDDDAVESSIANSRSLQASRRRKDVTLNYVQHLEIEEGSIRSKMASCRGYIPQGESTTSGIRQVEDITASDAESKLSLIIQKSDFGNMRVAGQFNLGFIIAVRPALEEAQHDELFIIDQHASDEKYNFERLQEVTVVQSQRLVYPKILELTALEEEIVMSNIQAIEANGFQIDIDIEGGMAVGQRCQLTALPLSRETTFSVIDLEELISLLGDEGSESKHIPRPSKVRKMFAMRACRSSVMIGKALTQSQMYSLVGHMGELDKPWNCPHGRPTMRHLCRLQAWDDLGWKGDVDDGSVEDWASYIRG